MMSTTRTLAAAALAAAILIPTAAQSHGAERGRTEYMPCANAGQTNCVWDAQHMGNGIGQSYFVGRDGKVYPLPHHIAHFLIYGD